MKKRLQKHYYKLLKWKNRLLYGKPVLVTMYHRVNDVTEDRLAHLTVSLTNFEKQLCYYKQNYQILNLNEEWTALKKTGVVITFDDGYADNIINALPLLEKYQIPATIFVTTLNTDTKNEFWWDRLLFDYSYCKESFYFPGTKDKVSKTTHSYKFVNDYLSKMPNENKEIWLLRFEEINAIPFFHREAYRSLTSEELKFLSEHPLITLGIHTHNHYSLGDLTFENQKQELSLTIQRLNQITNKNIKYIALPHGSYNSDTYRVMDEFGIQSMLLANNYYSNWNNKASRKINRILVPNIVDQDLSSYIKQYDF